MANQLLDVTERVMLDEGYAAVSSRRVASEAGVTGALVHYYFPTLDDLFLAVLRRRAESQIERQRRAVLSPQPLRAVWRMSTDPDGAAMLMELMALSNHRKAIGTELAAYADQFRNFQVESIGSHLREIGLDTDSYDPAAVLALIAAVSSSIMMEEALGMTSGVAELRGLVEATLERFEGPAEPRARSKSARSTRRPRRAVGERR